MAQTRFESKEPKKVSLDAVKKTAQRADEKNAAFRIPAEVGATLTLTGEFFESVWESYEGTKKTGTGTNILVGVEELKAPLRLSFFRSKSLREENGNKSFKACFPKDASFEDMVTGIEAKKGTKVVVKRDDYVFPGRASARQVDTLDWAE